MTKTVEELLAALTPDQKSGLSWGDRGDGKHWQARHGGRTTIGNGGPYPSAQAAIRAVLGLEGSLR